MSRINVAVLRRHHDAGEGAWRRLSDWRLPCDTEASKGMTVGSHGSTSAVTRWRWPLVMPCSTCSRRTALWIAYARMRCFFKQRLAEMKDRHGSVIAEVRGEGLLIGLRVTRKRRK